MTRWAEAGFKSGLIRKNRRVVLHCWPAVVGVLAALGGFLVGILIGRFAIPRPDEDGHREPQFDSWQDQQAVYPDVPVEISASFHERISADNIKNYLRDITARPHLAGTANSEHLARQLEQFWNELGLDDVKLVPYNILLPYPNISDPNRVELTDIDRNVIFTSSPVETSQTAEDNIDQAVPPYHGFTPSGDVEGDLVYVNYGRFEDFDALISYMSVNMTGKLVIARYGKTFRGDIVGMAERFGAAGVILYSDPKDYTWGPAVYPHDWWLPGSAVQRGTVYMGAGDPLTPGYPSIKSAYRLPSTKESKDFPKIPSQPIGYDDARILLSRLRGTIAPESWRGGLNITYRIGGLGRQQGIVRLHVTNRNERRTVYNVIGIIRGKVEPDRYVIIGNHRDAWGYGAFDPGSGSAIMKELSRVYAGMVKEGWRPRRSLLFCSWAAEEHGLIGSTEWVEQFTKVLDNRAVAYLNIDTAVQGNFSLEGNASPLLYSTLYEATKRVPNPNLREREAGISSVYDKWIRVFPWRYKNHTLNRPKLGNLGAASDYATFYQRLGIPAADVHYVYDKSIFKDISYHPLYHTAYDTFYSFQSFADQNFQISKTMTHIWAETSKLLLDSDVLPFNVSDFAEALVHFKDEIVESHGRVLEMAGSITISEFTNAVKHFKQEAKDFTVRISNINQSSPLVLRMVNDQLMMIERAFIDPAGLPGRPYAKHVVMAQSLADTYAGSSFPGLIDALVELESSTNPENHWERVKQQWSITVYTILSAASTLRNVTNFMSDYFV